MSKQDEFFNKANGSFLSRILALFSPAKTARVTYHIADPWRDDPATEKQFNFLEDLGEDVDDLRARRITKGQASDIISRYTGK